MLSKFFRKPEPKVPVDRVVETPPKIIPQVIVEEQKPEDTQKPSLDAETRSILHDGIKIVGNWSSDGPVDFGGTIEGDLTANTLTVSSTGRVSGDIHADRIEICGTIHGNIYADILVLRAGSVVTSEIYVANLTIDAGAQVSATIHMTDNNQTF